ncbi:glycosyltransferase [Cribrihabitans marinus]|nr:glycosyltransferase [Cribrihabitans marinus]
MVRIIKALFQRYAETHLEVNCDGFVLRNELGQRIGHLDRYGIANGRLYATGWTNATQVALITEGQRSQAAPTLSRKDVAAILEPGATDMVGFHVDHPLAQGWIMFSVELGDHRYFSSLPPVPDSRIRAARRRLIPGFLIRLLRASPAALRWKLHGRPQDRAAVKRFLHLDEDAGRNMVPGIPLFPTEENPPVQPEGLEDVEITIVLPVYNAFDLLPEALDRVVRHTDLPWHLVVVEDCSTDANIRPWLRTWAAEQGSVRVTLLENSENRGFIRSVNRAFAVARDRNNHVVLLNSDAFVPEGWASRLIRPLLAHDAVASVTPMSNDAEIFTIPVICHRNDLTPGEANVIDRVARQFHPDADIAEAPTGVGFCMAMNIQYLADLPEFDTKFGRGYGEEVDWCQRARAIGGRHLGLPSLFVEHRGGSSFGSAEKLKLIRRNSDTISERYPNYDRDVQDFIRADLLAAPRVALGLALAAERSDRPIPVYLAHSMGGGAEKYLEQRIAQNIEAVGAAMVLRIGGSYRWQLELHGHDGISRTVSEDFEMVRQILDIPEALEIVYSCGVGDRNPVEIPGNLIALKRGKQDRLEVLFHDFFPISPSFNLLGQDRHFRGVPDRTSTETIHTTRQPNGRKVSLRRWRKEWGALMKAADRIVTFSEDSRSHVTVAYPDLPIEIDVMPHQLSSLLPKIEHKSPRPPVIGVLGAIGYEKGAAVLAQLSCELDRLGYNPLVVIGEVDPSFIFSATARIHGRYRFDDLPDLIQRYEITHWLIPSICPETFSFATHEVLSTGLPVYCFDLGAQAEAVGTARNGTVIPLPEDRETLPICIIEAIFGDDTPKESHRTTGLNDGGSSEVQKIALVATEKDQSDRQEPQTQPEDIDR